MSESQVELQPAPEVEAAEPAPSQPAAPLAPALRTTTPTTAILVPWESALPGVSSSEIRAELARRQRRVPKLMAERAQVIAQLEAIEDALESIGESVPELETDTVPDEAKVPRARNAVSLRDAIAAAVPGGSIVTPAEVAEAVRAGGYTTTAANLGQMVASALAKDGRFERVGRGRYKRAS